MAVQSIKRIHEGRASETVFDGRRTVIRYTDVYRAITTTNYTEPETIKIHPDCPKIGQQMLRDPRAYCQAVRVDNEFFSKRVYRVSVGYSTEREMAVDPTTEPAYIVWRTESFQVPVVKDRNGVAHTNTACDPFDPPAMMEDDRWHVLVRKNVPTVPAWLLTYRKAVNNAPWTLDGVALPKGFARLNMIEIGGWEERNGYPYRLLTMGFLIAEMDSTTGLVKWDAGTNTYVALGATEFEHAHAAISLNQGMHHILASTIKDECKVNNEAAMTPQLLDINGLQITSDNPSDAIYVVSDIYREKNFNLLPTA